MDELAEHPDQIDKTPYDYVWNNPISKNDPDGKCPSCIIAVTLEAAGAEEVGSGGLGTPVAVATIGAGLVVAGVDALWTWGSNAYHQHQAAQMQSRSSKKGDTPENPQPSSRAARRDAMRKGGVPTSQPLHQDKKSNSEDQVLLDRDGEHTVQDAK